MPRQALKLVHLVSLFVVLLVVPATTGPSRAEAAPFFDERSC